MANKRVQFVHNDMIKESEIVRTLIINGFAVDFKMKENGFTFCETVVPKNWADWLAEVTTWKYIKSA